MNDFQLGVYLGLKAGRNGTAGGGLAALYLYIFENPGIHVRGIDLGKGNNEQNNVHRLEKLGAVRTEVVLTGKQQLRLRRCYVTEAPPRDP